MKARIQKIALTIAKVTAIGLALTVSACIVLDAQESGQGHGQPDSADAATAPEPPHIPPYLTTSKSGMPTLRATPRPPESPAAQPEPFLHSSKSLQFSPTPKQTQPRAFLPTTKSVAIPKGTLGQDSAQTRQPPRK